MAKKKSLIPGLSFSWKRATGVTSVKRKIAKATGIPTTKAGRQRKLGKIFGIKGGPPWDCLTSFASREKGRRRATR